MICECLAKVTTKAIPFAFAAGVAVTAMAAANHPLQASGVVLDRDTKQPVAGAYVLATYYVTKEDYFAVARKCVKNRGMYTAADGKYSFPLEGKNGDSPGLIIAIKPDYESGVFEPAKKTDRGLVPADFFDTTIRLQRRNPTDRDFPYGASDVNCAGALTPRDAAAGTEWLRIELKEREKYNRPGPQLEFLRKTIKEREALEEAIK